jgi:hypothetical protein
MRKIFSLKRVLLALLVIFLIMQLFRIDKTNPPVVQDLDFINTMNPPQEVATVLKAACYDCHSNTTQYPWYSNIAPASWWLKDHINEGRKEMNLSEWQNFTPKRKQKKLDECLEMVKEGEMPLKSYTWIHKEAKLTQDQRALLTTWFQSVGARAEGEGED